jgi:hypothetical protein
MFRDVFSARIDGRLINISSSVARSVTHLTTKVPALAAVQTAKTTLAESLTKIHPRFSTAFCTGVLKTFFANGDEKYSHIQKAAPLGG